MRLIISLALAAALPLGARSAETSISTVTTDGRSVSVTVVNDNILRVSNATTGERPAQSRATVLAPRAGSATAGKCGHIATLATATGVVATLDTRTGAVSINAGADRAVSDPGERTAGPDGKRTLQLYTMGSGSFYGAGERGHSFNLKGDTLVMYNRQNYGYTDSDPRISQMNITMPLFVSSAGYAVVFDDHAAATMTLTNPITYTTESPAPIDYYFINGAGSLPEAERQLTLLTGRQDLPPFWALGYITSKYGYRDEAETRGVVDTLKLNGYPLDGVVLDLYWYGQEQDMGRLAWDPDQWPTHHDMLTDLKERGVNTIVISQPYVLRNGRAIDNYRTLADGGLLVADSTGTAPQEVKIWVGEGGMFDVSNPDTRAWLRERYRALTADGVGGWWGDLGEPEVHPETALHHNGLTARQYHNQYGNDWSQIIYDLFRDEFPDTRLMTMMRGGTTGLQRYSVYPWSTDVSRSWGGLQPQVKIMLNSGLSGLGYMSHDVGGFAIDPEHPVDPELYVRWLQLGLFSPILRTHAQSVAEPYRYPEQQHIILPLVKARYQWLPYNYTLAWENAADGQPLVRPLNYYSPVADQALDSITDQYLWGRDVMIAPVLQQGATERRIVFPQGTWLDITQPSAKYSGGDIIEAYPAPLDVIPMFVRAGAFLPMADYPMESTLDYNPALYTIHYYPQEGTESAYTMYEDDRTSPSAISSGAHSLITFTGNDTPEAITITATCDGTYPGAPATKTLTFRIHDIKAAPASVTLCGKRLGRKAWSYDKATGTLTVKAPWTVAAPLTLDIRK